MEDFNLELLKKFRNFKIEKFSEQDRVNEDQENKIKSFISVSEEVTQYLHSSILGLEKKVKDLKRELVSLRTTKDEQSMEYQNLLIEEEQKVEVLKLRLKIEKERTKSQANEIASLRAANDDEIMEYQKCLMEEKQKNKELSDEVERLTQLQDKLISSRLKDTREVSREKTKLMEDFNLELHQKFEKFKTENFSELDRVIEDLKEKFMNLIAVSEDRHNYSLSSILELETQVEYLNKELDSLRATKAEQSMEYQNLLMEEKQKVEVLELRLGIEKETIQAQANEIASLRAANDDEIMEYQKLLMEEKQKNTDEVEKLKHLRDELISRMKDTKEAPWRISHVSRETSDHTKGAWGR